MTPLYYQSKTCLSSGACSAIISDSTRNFEHSGSPSRVVRPPRSRSAGGQDSPSPQQSPFRRNAKANQSARQSPTHLHAAAKHSPRPARNFNTWNSSAGKKKRPVITEDTFCQQVAQIMQQYAAMMPSPRKDSKPDSRISTRIPAPRSAAGLISPNPQILPPVPGVH
ncbi:hypothetical protein V9T40_006471 [Parthenolecanium corni]|uniref:Uncharacterized protein n=1 Tax=Parthenolecanium corni TaxID=536013 RepID=A0AAN9Y7P0_9HEMI